MSGDDFFNGVQSGLTIWHDEQTIPGQEIRTVVLALFNGSIVYASGENATYAGVEIIDVADSKEPFSGNMTVLLKDGSISNQTFEGEATFKDSPGRVSGIGTWSMVGGTGRFANVHGGGQFKWAIDGDVYNAEFSG
jgi:hypothetical protein